MPHKTLVGKTGPLSFLLSSFTQNKIVNAIASLCISFVAIWYTFGTHTYRRNPNHCGATHTVGGIRATIGTQRNSTLRVVNFDLSV